ncbi:hypothetical protein [Thermodesulfatator indicus]
MTGIILKAAGIWLVIVLIAIVNGIFREKVLTPLLGSDLALPISGISLAMLVFVVSFIFIPTIGSLDPKIYILIGFLWLILTLLFEFIFGHYITGKPWKDVMQVFNLKKGDLFTVVLAATAVSPWLAAKIKGII